MTHVIYNPQGLSVAEIVALMDLIGVAGRSWREELIMLACRGHHPEINRDRVCTLRNLWDRIGSRGIDEIRMSGIAAVMASH